ncbi:hypothetical protein K505DRAFT_249559, partial [Melanomma pulvis-pyrius CBS 109.77]
VCDVATVNAEEDLQARDTIFPDGALETFQVHPSPTQKSYYLSQQQTNEATVMLHSESTGLTGVLHTALPNTRAADATEGRESVEVRAFMYYKDREDEP